MKNQALFSSKDKSKKLKCRLLQFLFGALRVKSPIVSAKYLPTEICFDEPKKKYSNTGKKDVYRP